MYMYMYVLYTYEDRIATAQITDIVYSIPGGDSRNNIWVKQNVSFVHGCFRLKHFKISFSRTRVIKVAIAFIN